MRAGSARQRSETEPQRLRARGEPPVAPDPALGAAADLLRMIAGMPAEPRRAEALDAYFTPVILIHDYNRAPKPQIVCPFQ
jgi:citrate synthase